LSHFVDEVHIHVASGKGGHGCVSFRREKYIPKGGPDGGDGGRGGDVIFFVRRNLKTLTHIRNRGKYFARNGIPGSGRNKSGEDGEDILIEVPPGSRVLDAQTREVLLDLEEDGQKLVFLKGGKGGQGNMHFATSRNQAPRYAQPGLPGEEREIIVEMNLIADIGFVGFPNAGKSTLLKSVTSANPKVGAYPFTTKIPSLGVLSVYDSELILADIPGIIEGASQGAGLGLRFLKHIHRTAGLAFLLDLEQDKDHVEEFHILLKELEDYEPSLVNKPRILIASKMDMPEAEEAFANLQKKLPGEKLLGISAHTHQGMQDLIHEFWLLAQKGRAETEETL